MTCGSGSGPRRRCRRCSPRSGLMWKNWQIGSALTSHRLPVRAFGRRPPFALSVRWMLRRESGKKTEGRQVEVVIFDLRGPLAHFRRPDTLRTHASYPFITRTALRGLAASVLGLDSVPPEVRCGLRLLSPVQTVAQQLTMHGKTWTRRQGKPNEFHSPTSIELVIKPHYRIYYTGPMVGELGRRIKAGQSHYHTYLGSAYCLTFPEWVGAYDCTAVPASRGNEETDCVSVVPSAAVKRLIPRDSHEYARVGGVLWEHLGGRRFRGTTSLIYEVRGRSVHFILTPPTTTAAWEFVDVPGEGIVCLW